MAQVYSFVDDNGVTRLFAEIHPDPAGTPYAPPTTREDFGGGGTVTIANGGTALLPWGTSFGPNTILDRSTPTVPSIAVAGIYAVSVAVAAVTNMTAGGFGALTLELDSDNLDASTLVQSRTATAADALPQWDTGGVLYFPANGTVRVRIHNYDGAGNVDFGIATAYVQRIT